MTAEEQLKNLSLDDAKKEMTPEEKYTIARSVGEECIQEEELLKLFASTKPKIIAYDGFEPSGRMHIAQVSPG
jgi:tyrosyl-tRNA synthetase